MPEGAIDQRTGRPSALLVATVATIVFLPISYLYWLHIVHPLMSSASIGTLRSGALDALWFTGADLIFFVTLMLMAVFLAKSGKKPLVLIAAAMWPVTTFGILALWPLQPVWLVLYSVLAALVFLAPALAVSPRDRSDARRRPRGAAVFSLLICGLIAAGLCTTAFWPPRYGIGVPVPVVWEACVFFLFGAATGARGPFFPWAQLGVCALFLVATIASLSAFFEAAGVLHLIDFHHFISQEVWRFWPMLAACLIGSLWQPLSRVLHRERATAVAEVA